MRSNTSIRLGFLFVVLATASVLSTACEKDTLVHDRPNFYSGTITDSATGIAIESASVGTDTIGVGPYLSDSGGHYRGLTYSSRITIYVQKTGYQTQSRSLYFTKDLTGVDFKLVQ
jgi:hypothetical protein